METISLKSNVRNAYTKQKGIYTNGDSLELFLECQFSIISLKIGYFLYTFLLLYGIVAILLFNVKVKLIKPSRTHE